MNMATKPVETSQLPTHERPWEKYYKKVVTDDELLALCSKTVYQHLLDNNRAYGERIALEYFGAKISYKQLFCNIDKTAKAFSAYGVQQGDFITICSAGLPEVVYTFYALSKIGAVSNMMAPYFDKKDMIARIKDCKSKILIVMDKFYPIIKDVIKSAKIETLIILPTMNASPMSFFFSHLKTDFPSMTWNQFIKKGKYQPEITAVPCSPQTPLAMVYSSGTTGSSKGILLSNDSFQRSVCAYMNSGIDMSRNQKFYQLVPTWFSTGISTSVNLPLSCGVSVYMDPRFEKEVFVKNLSKAKPSYVAAPTSMYEGLLNSELVKNKDFSSLRYPFEGGEPLKLETAAAINRVLEEHGSKAKLLVGYGQCECGAGVATQTPYTPLCNGSVGIPIPGVTIGVFDDEYKELSYLEHGHILVCTPCSMLEYYKNSEATKDYFYVDGNNRRWNRTGDMGYMDKNGNLYILGRDTDFTRVNGKKVYHFDLENILISISYVVGCEVLTFKMDHSEKICAHLVFEESFAEQLADSKLLNRTIFEIQSRIFEITHDLDTVPLYFKVRREFPVAPSGKRDTAAMSSETDGFIYSAFHKKIKP